MSSSSSTPIESGEIRYPRSRSRSRTFHHRHQQSRSSGRNPRSLSPRQGRQPRNERQRSRSPGCNHFDKRPFHSRHGRPHRSLKQHTGVVIVIGNTTDDRYWKQRLALVYAIYDLLYPYRQGSRIILRQNKRWSGRGVSYGVNVEDFTRFVAAMVNDKYGAKFVVDQFLDWFKNECRGTSVAIFGLTRDDTDAIAKLEARGAIVVYEPEKTSSKYAQFEDDIRRAMQESRFE